VATLLTPDDVLDSAPPVRLQTQLWDSPGARRGVRSLGSSVRIPAVDHFGLKSAIENNWVGRYGTAAAAFALVGLVCWAATRWIAHPAPDTGAVRSVDGLTIFAVFFVAALAIERLLEPLSNAMLPRAERTMNAQDAMRQAKKAAADYRDSLDQDDPDVDTKAVESEGTATTRAHAAHTEHESPENDGNRVVPDAPSPTASQNKTDPADDANNAIRKAAKAMEALSVRQLQRTTVFWAIATCLAMLMAAVMNLYFLKTVGLTVGDPWEEILATGLIIGGGTKPLHDLVKLISTTPAGIEGDSG
jgi:hypothetical protein